MMTTASISGNNNHNNNAANGFRPNCSPLSSSNNYNHDNSNSKSFLSPSRTVITSFTPRRPTCYVGAGDATTLLSPYEEGDWVLCLTTDCCPNNSRLGGSTGTAAESLACALSNGEIQVYDAQRLHLVRSYRHHHHHHHHPSMNHKPQQNHNNATTTTSTTCVTDLQYGPQKHIILSAGQDGMVNLFDLRSSSQAQQAQAQIRLPPASSLSSSSSLSSKALCMALGYDGTILAVGSTKGRILFWDWRQPQTLLGTYGNSHKDDVTCLQFSNAHNNNNNNNSLLLSGSEDGLVCLLDTTQATEELALQSIVNVHAPIRKAGFCGNHHPSFYCLTGNETLHLYQSDSGSVCQQQQQQQFARDHFWNATTTTTTTTTSPATTSISHHHDSMWASIDYLVDAYWDQTHNQLLVLAGGRQASSSSTVAAETGNSALFAIVEDQNNNNKHNHHNNHENAQGAWMSSSSSSWKIQHQESFVGGHNGVLRAWCPLGKSATGTTTSTTDGGGLFSSIVTAGEDARLCEWHIPPSTASAKVAAAAAASFAGTKRPNGSPTNQHHHGGGSGGGGPFRRQRHKTSTSPY
ncbi:hypothetical protein ACA910_020233 [Epithemia clementina (nom. ined.)]